MGHPSVDPALPHPPSLLPQVLKILLHLCGHGSSSFLLILKRNPAFIQEAAGTGQHCPWEAQGGRWPGQVSARSLNPSPCLPAPYLCAPLCPVHTVLHCQFLPPSRPGQASTRHRMTGVCPCSVLVAWTFPVCPCLGFPVLPRAAPSDPRKPSILGRAGRVGDQTSEAVGRRGTLACGDPGDR